MRIAMKRPRRVRACRLGDGSPLEAELLQAGRLRRRSDGGWEVFSREARNGEGQRVETGDYVKLDDGGWPYPNDRAFFEANHDWVEGETYCQRGNRVGAWLAGDPPCPPLTFLLKTGRLTLREDDPERYYSAVLWGAPLSAPRDAVLVFYRVARDGDGAVTDVEFNFVVREEFARTYDWVEA